jgi:hypothetical protein
VHYQFYTNIERWSALIGCHCKTNLHRQCISIKLGLKRVYIQSLLGWQSYFMWDSFTSGVAVSIMRNSNRNKGENEFAEMEYINITVVTSNKPYGISDGSNPLFDGLKVPKFNLKKGGVHSGHIQQGLTDPFCFVKNGKGRCQVVAFLSNWYTLSL